MGIALITKDYENTVGKQRMPVIVEFYASWCPKCGMMYPVVKGLPAGIRENGFFIRLILIYRKRLQSI